MKSLDWNKARLGVGIAALVFLLAGTARANERSSAISGPTGAQASLALQVTDPQPVVFDAWDVIKSFETRTCTILEGHSGYRDLLHSQFNQLYPFATSPAPVRYFRKQTVTSSWSFQNGLFSGDMNFTIQKDNADVAVFGPGTLHMTYLNADGSRRESWVNKDATPPVYRQTPILSGKGYVPGTYNLGSETRVVFPGTVHTLGGGAVDAQDVSCATPNDLDVGFRPIYLGADQINPIVTYPIVPIFGASSKITLWNATKIVFNTDQARNTPGTLNYTLELSDEDTLTNVQSRLDASWQANALDTLRWGFDRMVEGPWVSDQPTPPNENIIYLYNTHDFAFWGFFQEARGQLRFNVPAALQVPGVSYRGRVLEVFYPDSDTYNGQVVKIHEVEMKAGQWQSPIITPVMRPENGETDLQAFSVVAEPIRPRQILSLPSSNPSADTAPPEYQKTRPTIAAQDLVTAGAGTRNVLTGSLTLQQINLSDSSGTLAQWPGATATWSVLPGATAQVRLWRWTADATPLGTWTLVGPNDNLAAYFGSKTNYIFAEALSSGRATVRITTTLGGQAVHDDIEVKSGVGELAVDANRDGVIRLSSEDPTDATSADKPFRFWINNDDDAGLGPPHRDCEDNVINGKNDLKDFFPVFLNIKTLLAALPPSSGATYTLKQDDSAVNFHYTDYSRTDAFIYRDPAQSIPDPSTQRVTAQGVRLTDAFLNTIKDGDKGVILVEGAAATTKPLVLVVEKDGVTLSQISLPLSIGQRIVLLLHGMNSDTNTWNDFVQASFGNSAPVIFGGENIDPNPPKLDSHGVCCYRLQFGAADGTALGGRFGLEGVNSVTDGYIPCGDFEDFSTLGDEVRQAVGELNIMYPNAQIVLVGHSRGGIAARAYLQTVDNSFPSPKASVVGLLTTGSPQHGSRIGRIYQWLKDNPRTPIHNPETPNNVDWDVVDWLRQDTALLFVPKPPLDVRRPVINDMADNTPALDLLNSYVSRMPPGIRYGEIVYSEVKLGILKYGTPQYSVFDNSGPSAFPQLSPTAEAYILGTDGTDLQNSAAKSSYRGDGLVPMASQLYSTLPGFPGTRIKPMVRVDGTVVHTAEPQQVSDLNEQLRKLVDWWK